MRKQFPNGAQVPVLEQQGQDMMKGTIWQTAIAAGILGSTAAQAQVTTLDYQGTAFNGSIETIDASGFTSFGSLSSGPATGDIVLANPLDPNASDQLVTPLSWNFDSVSGPFALDSSNSPGIESTLFSFTTQNGQITSWDMQISLGTLGGSGTTAVQTFDSFGPGQGYGAGQDLSMWELVAPTGAQIVQNASIGPGNWSQTVQAPELDPSTTFSALTFLVGCLAVLMGRRRKGYGSK